MKIKAFPETLNHKIINNITYMGNLNIHVVVY